jgi:putative ABC transport system permease protein
MNFVFNMAWREIRASWRRLLLFFLCIAIGVGSIVSLRSLVQNLKASVMREARSLLAADAQLGVHQPWKPETRSSLERFSNLPVVAGHTEVFETQTMARAANNQSAPPFIIELRGVQEQFPLYGEVQLAGGTRYTHALLRDRGALAHASVLDRLNLKVGDEVKIGQVVFTIRGALKRVPGSEARFDLIPRVLVDLADVQATGLAAFGSRVSYKWLLKAREGQDQAMLQELRREFRTLRVDFWWSFRELEGTISERLRLTEGFVGLVGLAILALGGIGVASVTRVFVQQKLKTIAILKCLGGENRRVLSAYLAQALALSLAGSGAGLLLASVITILIPRYAAGRLPIELESGLTWQASVQGVGVGVIVALLFSLPLLLEIRQVKPILVLRQSTTARRRRIDWLRLGAWATIAPALFGLAIWQSGSLRYALIFLGIAVATILVLGLAGGALTHSLRRVRRLPSFALRQGVSSLYRPGNQTRTILFAVGLGALFVIAVRIQQANVMKEYDFDLNAASADMFLIDIQKDQRSAIEGAIARFGDGAPTIIPVVQGRIIGLMRAPGNSSDMSREQVGRTLGWERRFSYRPRLEESEEIIAGKFWEPQPAAEPEISVEESYARDLQLGLGDTLIFDFLGRRIEAKITSVRRVERRVSPLAYLTRATVLFRPGALEAAPQFFIGAVKGPPPGAMRAQLQREFVEQFPNVTMIDAFDAIAEIRKRAGEISFAVSFIGGFVFLCGALILAGSVAMTKYQRLYEAAILKTLGAEKKLIVYITLIEYGVLGLMAGAIGSSAAIGLTWAISKYGMKIPWQLAPSVNLIGVAVTMLLVMAVGALSSWDVMTKKPLGILRAE